MKPQLLLVLVIGLISACISSKRTVFLKVPTSSEAVEKIDFSSYETKYDKYDGVYLLWEKTLEHVGGKNPGLFAQYGAPGKWTFHEITRRKYLVLNADNETLATFTKSIPTQAILGDLFLRITYPDGHVKQFSEPDLIKKSDNKYQQTYKFAYPKVQKGCIIEEGFDISYSLVYSFPPLSHDIPLQFTIPCEQISFSYAYPDWWKIQAKKIGQSKTILYTVEQHPQNHKTIITYRNKNVDAINNEPYSPFFKEMADYLQFMVTDFRMLGLVYKSSENWSELMVSLRKANMNKDGFLSKLVANTTKEIIKDSETRLEKLDTIITYLQTNIEVSNEYDNRNFKNILKDKKGSLSRITGLAHSMLSKAGINAQYLLLHSVKDGFFDKDFISPSQFTIPALGVIVDSSRYVVFPYDKIPIGHIPEHFQGQLALGISGDKTTKGVQFWEIPSGARTQNTVDVKFNLIIDTEGIIKVNEEKTLQGSDAYTVRRKLEDLTNEELEEEMKEMITYADGDVEIESYQVINMDAYKKPLIMKANYTIDNLVTLTPEEVIFQTGGLFSPVSGKKYKIDSQEHQNPIRIYYIDSLNKTITITFPRNWEIETQLKDVAFENNFGVINGQYQIKNGLISVVQNRLLKKFQESKEKITELLELIGERSKLAIPTIVFKIKDLSAQEN